LEELEERRVERGECPPRQDNEGDGRNGSYESYGTGKASKRSHYA